SSGTGSGGCWGLSAIEISKKIDRGNQVAHQSREITDIWNQRKKKRCCTFRISMPGGRSPVVVRYAMICRLSVPSVALSVGNRCASSSTSCTASLLVAVRLIRYAGGRCIRHQAANAPSWVTKGLDGLVR